MGDRLTMNDATPQKQLASADIARVMKLLPHRYPFLLIDRIDEMDGDNSAVGLKNVTINEPFFPGHFPDFPVMPGVLIIEGLAQDRLCGRAADLVVVGQTGNVVNQLAIQERRPGLERIGHRHAVSLH